MMFRFPSNLRAVDSFPKILAGPIFLAFTPPKTKGISFSALRKFEMLFR